MKYIYLLLIAFLFPEFKALGNGFVPNLGQYPHIPPSHETSYLAHLAPGVIAHINSAGITYHLAACPINVFSESGVLTRASIETIPITWIGAQKNIRPQLQKPGAHYNYYYPHATFTDLVSYQELIYPNIYPGIDLVFTLAPVGKDKFSSFQLKYDWQLHPGAALEKIQIQLPSAPELSPDKKSFQLNTPLALLKENIPQSFLKRNGKKQATTVYYQWNGSILSYSAPERQMGEELLIDPLVFAFRYGGAENDIFQDIDAFEDGSFVAVGVTQSYNLFTLRSQSNAYLSPFNGGNTDMFIFKANNQGQAQWITYYGGSGEDAATAVAFDKNGNVVVAGNTSSIDFPRTFSPLHYRQDYLNQEVAVLKFSGAGQRQFAFLYGGSEKENVTDLAVSPANEILIGGATASGNLPLLSVSPLQYQQAFSPGLQEAWLAKFNELGALLWSMYLGGAGADQITGLTVNQQGYIGVVGQTQSINFPTTNNPNQYVQTLQGGQDAFLALFDPLGIRQWSLLLGGNEREWLEPHSIVVTSKNDFIISGATSSLNLPGAINSYAGGSQDAFWAAFTFEGGLIQSSYYGGDRADRATAIAIDRLNHFTFTGSTRSRDFPVTNLTLQYSQPFQSTNEEVFVVQYDSLLQRRMAFLYGDIDNDSPTAIAPKGATGIIIAGQTRSSDIPLTAETWHYTQAASSEVDGFIAYFEGPPSIAPCAPLLINEVAAGSQAPFIELLVNGCPGSFQDLRNIIIDDNSGRGNACSLPTTITPGHMRFKNIPSWRQIPVGSLLVIYNPSAPPAGALPDPQDSNQDGVYYIPASDTNFFDVYSAYPAAGNCNFYFPIGPKNQTPGWATLELSAQQDLVQLVSPISGEVYHSVAWNLPPSGMPVTFDAPLPQNSSFHFSNQSNNDAFLSQNWRIAPPSPGRGNTAINERYITFLRTPLQIQTPPAPSICSVGDSAAISLRQTSPWVTYRWKPASGLSDTIGPVLRAKPTQTTVYTIEASPETPRWNTSCGRCPKVEAQLSVTVIPSPPAPLIFANDPVCENGNLILSASNVGNVQYLWRQSNNFIANTRFTRVSSVSLGSVFSLVAISERGCSSDIRTYTPTIVPAPTLTATITPASFRQGSDGEIQLQIFSDFGPFTILWRDSANQIIGESAHIRGVSPGKYIAEVTDFVGCTQRRVYEVPFVPNFSIEVITLKKLLCPGDNTGAISVRPINGVPPFRYEWRGNNGFRSESPVITNLSAGAYELRVIDSQGSETYYQTELAEPIPPQARLIAQKPVSCAGRKDGVLAVSLEGGRAPYTYFWEDTPLQTLSRENLAPGRYRITVIDDNNCQAQYNFIIGEVPEIQQQTSQIIMPRCDSLGAICIRLEGGTPPFTYTWSDGFAGLNQEGACIGRQKLRGGVYKLTVSDKNQCTQSWEYRLPQVSEINPSVIEKTTTACPNAQNGILELTATGGTPPYTFAWEDGVSAARRQDLKAGRYKITVKDAAHCFATLETEIAVSPNPILPNVRIIDYQNVTCAGAVNGLIKLSAELQGSLGYTPQWEYALDDGNWQESPIFNVRAGIYSGKVRLQDLGCESEFTAPLLITEPETLSLHTLQANSRHTLIAGWSGSSGATTYTLQYRIVDENSWQTIAGINQSHYLITGLQPNTEYEVRVGNVCENEVTQWSAPLRRRTLPDNFQVCATPRSFYIAQREADKALLQWGSVVGAVCYGVSYAANEAILNWQEEWINAPFYVLAGLEAEKEYFVRVRANCSLCSNNGSISAFSSILRIPALGGNKNGITEEAAPEGIVLYPNPMHENATLALNFSDPGFAEITILDSQGKLKLYKRLFWEEQQKEIVIEGADWAAGIYFIKVNLNGVAYGLRMLKE